MSLRTYPSYLTVIVALLCCGCREKNTDDTEDRIFPDPTVRTAFRLHALEHRIQDWRRAGGGFPKDFAELSRRLPREAVPQALEDGWNRVIAYTAKDSQFELRSAGPDGTFGDRDDIVVRGVP